MASRNGSTASGGGDLLARLELYGSTEESSTEAFANSLMLDTFAHLNTISPTLSSSANRSIGSITATAAPHWFCDKAERATVESATYLIRLHAFTSDHVPIWKRHCSDIIHSCISCCAKYQAKKNQLRKTYLADYPSNVLDSFLDAVNDWEAQEIRHVLGTSGNPSQGVIFHVLSSVALLRRPDLLEFVKTYDFHTMDVAFPSTVPVGVLVLLADTSIELRSLGQRIANYFLPGDDVHQPAIDIIVALFARLTSARSPVNAIFLDSTASTVLDLWAVIPGILAQLSPGCIKTRLVIKGMNLYITRPVFANLAGVETMPSVLACFVQFLTALGPNLWAHETPKYPEVIFDTIKDNAGMTALLAAQSPSSTLWKLEWLQLFLESIWDSPTFATVLPKVFVYLGEELQHVSIDPSVHSQAHRALFKIMSALRDKVSSTPHNSPQAEALHHACDTHAQMVTRAAFSSRHSIDSVSLTSSFSNQETRKLALEFLQKTLLSDATATVDCLYSLCPFRDEQAALDKRHSPASFFSKSLPPDTKLSHSSPEFRSPLPPPVRIHARLWAASYAAMRKVDPDATELVILVNAPTAHIDPLLASSKMPFSGGPLERHPDHFMREKFETVVRSINTSLTVMRSGFLKQVEGYADASGRASLRAFLSTSARPGIVQSVMRLMLSPIDDLNDASKSLVLNAYDAVERAACFRALFERHPRAAFEGLTDYLKAFTKHATTVPEACAVSKALVRCVKDILDSLGDATGLLGRPDYGRGTGKDGDDGADLLVWLPKTWKLMADSLSLIFQRTKFWAPYFPNQEMVTWMRDAIIFGRDMVSYIDTFQSAIQDRRLEVDVKGKGKGEASTAGQSNLISDLGNILSQLIEWLRITDPEILHQTHELITSYLAYFAASPSDPPPEQTIGTLERYAEKRRGTRTELSDEKLAELLASLEPFLDDEVTIIEPPPKKPSEVKTKKETARVTSATPKQTAKEATKDAHKAAWEKLKQTSTVVKGVKPTAPKKPAGIIGSSSSKVTSSTKQSTSRPPVKPAPRPAEGPSNLAIQNYKRMQQAEKATSNILSGPVRIPATIPPPIAPADVSSESSDEDEDEEDGLASLRDKVPKTNPAERRSIKVLPLAVPVRPQKINRHEEARRQGLRLKPDLSSLHRSILHWDYDYDGPEPPDTPLTLLPVPDSFPGSDENAISRYQQIFQPLILLETWSGLVKSKEENPLVMEAEIGSRRRTDSWTDLDMIMRDAVPPNWWLSETDIVLLRPLNGPGSVLAKVMGSKRSFEGLSATVRCSLVTDRLSMMSSALGIQTKWRLSRVFSLSTVHREYGALMGLQYYDLFRPIMDPPRRPLYNVSAREVQEATRTYGVNEPQARAILGSLASKGFSLIQGPPGTGKTSTIMALVGTFLAKRPPPQTKIRPDRPSNASDVEPVKKILICAPSNAAIDEVAYRLKKGIKTAQGSTFVPKIVRVGAGDKMSPLVKDLSLEELVDALTKNDPKAADLSALREAAATVKKKLDAALDAMNVPGLDSTRIDALDQEARNLRAERKRLQKQLDTTKDENERIRRNRDSNTRKYETQILRDADVICATLSGSGHQSLTAFTFETVIIDEAAQSVELSSLIPLKYGTTQAILVGDPQQLAPTVLSSRAQHFLYNQSLFVRLHKRQAAYLLSIQYRMHPDISRLPSRVFYDSKLEDADGMAKLREQPWHADPMFKPYHFIDVADGREEQASRGFSIMNRAEVRLAVLLYEKLRERFSSQIDFENRVGVIAMYDAQKQELQRGFIARFGNDITKRVSFGTVDGFQGQEKDIIIISTVRGGPSVSRIGHVADVRRMNVAVTRARSSLFILGHAATLERSDGKWKEIVQDARDRNFLTSVELSKTGGKLPIAAAKPMSLSSSRSNPGQRPISNGSAVVSNFPMGYSTTSSNPFPVASMQPVTQNGTALREDMVTDRDPATSRKRKQSDASIDNQPAPPPPSIATTIAGPSASIPPRMPPPKRKKKEADPFMPVKRR